MPRACSASAGTGRPRTACFDQELELLGQPVEPSGLPQEAIRFALARHRLELLGGKRREQHDGYVRRLVVRLQHAAQLVAGRPGMSTSVRITSGRQPPRTLSRFTYFVRRPDFKSRLVENTRREMESNLAVVDQQDLPLGHVHVQLLCHTRCVR